jgi:hypothetical protein
VITKSFDVEVDTFAIALNLRGNLNAVTRIGSKVTKLHRMFTAVSTPTKYIHAKTKL